MALLYRYPNPGVTLEHWNQLANHVEASGAQVLPGRHLLEEDGDAASEHGHEVDQQEGA